MNKEIKNEPIGTKKRNREIKDYLKFLIISNKNIIIKKSKNSKKNV